MSKLTDSIRCSRNTASLLVLVTLGGAMAAAAADETPPPQWQLIENHCYECHNAEDWAGGTAFDVLSPNDIVHDAETWEKAIRKLRGGMMPPPGEERLAESEVKDVVSWLETTIDAAATQPPPGRVPLRRLNRREYTYAIRDLLGLDIDVEALLPKDDVKGGYDNNAAALQVSPTFIDQYLNAARTVAHEAIGDPRPIPIMETYGKVADMIISLPPRGTPGTGTQQRHNQGMPFGTRGGMSVEHNFLADGEYELTIGDLALAREVPNMEFKNTVIALLDGKEFFRTEIGGEQDHKWIDQVLDDAVAQINERLRKIHFYATTGQHNITVTFLQRSFAESDERIRIRALEGGQDRVHGIHALQIRGPLSVDGMSASESRKRIFVCYPETQKQESPCAERIIRHLAERAFRRPLTAEDLTSLMVFYEKNRATQDFESSIKEALSAILVSPHFIYRAEEGRSKQGMLADDSTVLNDLELASRLSFFIWSSIPDEDLLSLAKANRLSEPAVLAAQVKRMLADPKARALVDDFSAQWLNLAKLDEITPNRGLFGYASGFLDPRTMFKQELSLFIDSVLRSDQSVVRLLDADYTFLNERLAMHYGIEDVKGSRFRRVTLQNSAHRGLLGKGAVLMMTANPNRTSPVVRGAWILERILGTPPPTPPPNVAAFPENHRGQPAKTVKERLEQHRKDPQCFSCHGVIDPLGLALENFNTVGQYRDFDRDTLTLIDASGVLPNGTPVKGPKELRAALLANADMFVQTFTENLMIYALGREIDYRDMPTVRKIVREAEQDNYRFESIVLNIVKSPAFRMRESVQQTEVPPIEAETTQVTATNGGQLLTEVADVFN